MENETLKPKTQNSHPTAHTSCLKVGILLDTTLDTNDGVQQYIKGLGRWLIKNGHDVKFLVGESIDEGEFKGKIINIGRTINIKSNGNKLSPAVLPNLSTIDKTIKDNKFDVLHLQMPYSPGVSGLFIKKSKVPTVATFHILPSNSFITFTNHLFSFGLGWQIEKFKKIMCVSTSAKSFFDPIYKTKSIVVPNMVDIAKFKTTEKIEKYNDGKVNILFFGRLVERKGAFYLLEAMKLIQEKLVENEYRILIAGDGYQREMLANYVKDNNILNVEFLGFINEEDKAKVYNTADICVFPATGGESFGIVLIEAMAAGKPVIAFDNPGYRSVLGDHTPELVIENKNPQKLGDKIYELIKDKNMREKIGDENKKEVEKYDVDNVCKKIFKIYMEAIN